MFAGGGRVFFLAPILAPDLSMPGYLAGPRVGAFAYNMLHAVIWPVGCGLKYATGFQDTHLGRIRRT